MGNQQSDESHWTAQDWIFSNPLNTIYLLSIFPQKVLVSNYSIDPERCLPLSDSISLFPAQLEISAEDSSGNIVRSQNRVRSKWEERLTIRFRGQPERNSPFDTLHYKPCGSPPDIFKMQVETAKFPQIKAAVDNTSVYGMNIFQSDQKDLLQFERGQRHPDGGLGLQRGRFGGG